jgi:HD-like signal output (HDOD) protein
MEPSSGVDLPDVAKRFAPEVLAERLQSLPRNRASAMRVLQVAGDQRASATDLAGALGSDAALATGVLKLANSAYYGLVGRVRDLQLAVSVVGFVSVHSLAAAHAAGALGPAAIVPPGFWDRATASAASCSALAPTLSVPRSEGLSLGLLHELGDFLLLQAAPEAHAMVHAATTSSGCRERAEVEHDVLGSHHGDLLAHSLQAWSFPTDFVDAFRSHPDATRTAEALPRTLRAGRALSSLTAQDDAEREPAQELAADLTEALDVAALPVEQAWTLSRVARSDAAQLALAFASADAA